MLLNVGYVIYLGRWNGQNVRGIQTSGKNVLESNQNQSRAQWSITQSRIQGIFSKRFKHPVSKALSKCHFKSYFHDFDKMKCNCPHEVLKRPTKNSKLRRGWKNSWKIDQTRLQVSVFDRQMAMDRHWTQWWSKAETRSIKWAIPLKWSTQTTNQMRVEAVSSWKYKQSVAVILPKEIQLISTSSVLQAIGEYYTTFRFTLNFIFNT